LTALTGIVRAVCISQVRGVQKHDIGQVRLSPDWGLAGDAHGGNWHRQVSLLSYEKIQEFNARGAGVDHGAFGENLVVEGIDFRRLPVGTLLRCGEARLELTQIGKECHSHCAIYHKMGDCIMPREGVFARVLQEGVIQTGDVMEAALPENRPLRAAAITLSDRGFRGERPDVSGPLLAEMLAAAGYVVAARLLLPDDREKL
jgi:MOSC domain-containing protein YiiM